MKRTSRYVIQNIFNCYKKQLASKRQPLKHTQAIEAITTCRTPSRGVSAYECEDSGSLTVIPHSCRHRSCYLCAQVSKQRWAQAQQKRLLNCAHFHCVFTLPSEYHVLWQYNQHWFTGTFFDVVNSVIHDLVKGEDKKELQPGVLMAMHTWGRQLSLHPHIHCVVTGGGLNDKGVWEDTGTYLMPGRQARALYRGRFQARIKEAIETEQLRLPPDHTAERMIRTYKQAYTKTWHVRIEEQYAHGRGVLRYLSRYLRGGPINPAQIRECSAEQITFTYKDHRDKRTKQLGLKPMEFIRRLLLHVPEGGQHQVRHYGLYAGASREKRNKCREQIGGLQEQLPEEAAQIESETNKLSCQCCGSGLQLKWTYYPSRKKGNSYRLKVKAGHVQQEDERDGEWAKNLIKSIKSNYFAHSPLLI